jgi:WD40 repeat protein
MGEVWRAYDLKLRVDVALKTLRAELIEKERALQALRQEVRTAREVMSPNVCRVFDLVELDGQELVSMEYIDGTTLLTVLRSRGPLELQEAREIATQFLAGLEAIHQAGLVHRDLKPENIMITRSGRVVVMDFGIAKGLSDRKTGTVSGTPAYMAPEQARGEEVDARADVFSAGVVLAEMIAPNGIKNLKGREAIWQGIHREQPELPDSPWAPVLTRAVARVAEQRHPSAAALARALEEVTVQVEGADDVQPYPGLASFTEEDAEYFFGRELEVEAMWKKLRRPHLLGLIGPSGAGKSSFLRAGLLPAMPEGWRSMICHPGASPFASLAQALFSEFSDDKEATRQLLRFEETDVAVSLITQWKKQHEQVIIILDQFEELFTLCPEEVQSRFAELLGRLVLEADAQVLLSMRDDFLSHCSHPALAPLFSDLTPLHPLSQAALRRALVQPALKCGYRFEDELLVEEMVGEVSEERGALPLLAFAAAKLWDHRDREKGFLTREAYEHIGGVGGALAQHAEATLEKIGNDRIPIVREIFRNLVTAQGTRAARDMEELLSVFENKHAARDVLRGLIDSRLLTSFEVTVDEEGKESRQRVEIIHESLLGAWPRLVRWQTQDQEGAQLRDQLRQAAQVWEQRGRSTDRLWTGTAVKEYQIWRERYCGGLTSTEEAFAQAMIHHAERRRRRRRLAVTTFIALLMGGLTLITALWQRSMAETRRAEASKLLALGQLELERYPTAAVAYALKSLELSDTQVARLFALEALQKGPTAFIIQPPEGIEAGRGWAYRVRFSPDSKWLAIDGADWVHIQSQNGEAPHLLCQPGAWSAFSPKGNHLATVRADEAQFWSVPDFKELGGAKNEKGPTGLGVTDEGFFTVTRAGNEMLLRKWSFDGRESQSVGRMNFTRFFDFDRKGLGIAYGMGRRIFLRSLTDWERSPKLEGELPAGVQDVTLHPNERLLVASDTSDEIRLWSLDSESKVPVRRFDGNGLSKLVFGSGDRLAAFGSPNGRPTVRLWNLMGSVDAEPTVLKRIDNLGMYLNDATFDPSGKWLATAHAWSVSLWPVGKRLPITLTGHEGRINAVKFTPDGKHLVSASGGDGTVRVWSLENDEPSRVILKQPTAFPSLAMDPAGKFIVVTGGRSSVFVVPLDGGAPRELKGFSPATSYLCVALDSERRLVAAAPMRGPIAEKVIRIWDLKSEKSWTLGPLDNAGDDVEGGFSSLHFLPDGRLLSNGKSNIHLWQPKDGHLKTLSEDQGGGISAFDGRFLLRSTQRSEPLVRFDIENGISEALSSHGVNVVRPALDPSGKLVLSTNVDGMVRVGPVTGEEPHILFAHEGIVWSATVSPNGQWIASSGADEKIRLWPMPDTHETPLHALPYEELLDRIRTVTNVRVVEDETSSTGYRLDFGPFPGWEEIPEW